MKKRRKTGFWGSERGFSHPETQNHQKSTKKVPFFMIFHNFFRILHNSIPLDLTKNRQKTRKNDHFSELPASFGKKKCQNLCTKFRNLKKKASKQYNQKRS